MTKQDQIETYHEILDKLEEKYKSEIITMIRNKEKENKNCIAIYRNEVMGIARKVAEELGVDAYLAAVAVIEKLHNSLRGYVGFNLLDGRAIETSEDYVDFSDEAPDWAEALKRLRSDSAIIIYTDAYIDPELVWRLV
jgi:saccharopine dehydrogenase-like NADP-dependent oxidoreductase